MIPGSAHAFTFKTLVDALLLRNHVIDRFERADVEAAALTGHAGPTTCMRSSCTILPADDGRAGLCMVPSVDPEGIATGRQMIVDCLVLVAASLMPVVVGGAGPVYLAGALLLGIGFLGYAVGFSLRRFTQRVRRGAAGVVG